MQYCTTNGPSGFGGCTDSRGPMNECCFGICSSREAHLGHAETRAATPSSVCEASASSATFKSLCNIHSERRYSHKQSSSVALNFTNHKSNSAIPLCIQHCTAVVLLGPMSHSSMLRIAHGHRGAWAAPFQTSLTPTIIITLFEPQRPRRLSPGQTVEMATLATIWCLQCSSKASTHSLQATNQAREQQPSPQEAARKRRC